MSGVVAIALAIGFGAAAGSFAAVMVVSRVRDAEGPADERRSAVPLAPEGPAITPRIAPEPQLRVDDAVDDLFDECTLETPTDYQAGAPRRASSVAYPNVEEGSTNPDPMHARHTDDLDEAPTVLLGRGDWGQDVADLVAELDL